MGIDYTKFSVVRRIELSSIRADVISICLTLGIGSNSTFLHHLLVGETALEPCQCAIFGFHLRDELLFRNGHLFLDL